VVSSIDDHIEWLEQQIDKLDQEIEAEISTYAALAECACRLATDQVLAAARRRSISRWDRVRMIRLSRASSRGANRLR